MAETENISREEYIKRYAKYVDNLRLFNSYNYYKGIGPIGVQGPRFRPDGVYKTSDVPALKMDADCRQFCEEHKVQPTLLGKVWNFMKSLA